ncbi:MAG: tRNA (N(6)-L-threonylcarbamoyladenosine(37)-C(2))-methylthiotransferase MtaB [Candidatus Izemoplasma sp.]
MKIAFYTLGCKVNTYETESISKTFTDNGYLRVSYREFADVYIINTCTVTNQASAKSRKIIRKLIKKNPEAVIAVMGCYSQVAEEEISKIDGVDIIIGTTHRERLFDLVQKVKSERIKIKEVIDVSRYLKFDEVNVTHFTENTRAFLKIQDGCNHFCTYCIIPFARGRVRSRKSISILDEAKELVKNGYLEIVLTGIHTGGYGFDLENNSLYNLLKDLAAIKGLKRIRLSSIEMNEITEEILQLYKTNKKFAKQLHLPLQSGSEEILKLMHRHYTLEEFRTKLAYIRKLIPGIAITTDVIVGFPGETEEQFEEMYNFIKEMEFSELHVFPFSKRNGTAAALMKNQINGTVKSVRVNKLLTLNEELATKFINDSVNVTQSVIFESCDDLYSYGHSSTYIKLKVPKDVKLTNKLVFVDIVNVKYQDSLGQIKK